MKCPKCQYIGFDGQSRCRNCGYDLSLASTLEVTPPASSRAGEEAPPPADAPPARMRNEPSAREQARAAIQRRAGTRTPSPEFDLPLFATPGADDRPALAPPARPPLSVRRTTGDGPRARAVAAAVVTPPPGPPIAAPSEVGGTMVPDVEAGLDLPLGPAGDERPAALADADLTIRMGEPSPAEVHGRATDPVAPVAADADAATVRLEAPVIAPRRDAPARGAADARVADAGGAARLDAPPREEVRDHPSPIDIDRDEAGLESGLVSRVLAGLVDIVLLAIVDGAIVMATLRVLGLDLAAVDRLPIAPMVVFFAVLALGYLTMCTVLAGQTLGKQIFGLKVIEPGGRPVRFGHAVVRAGLQVLTVPLLGLGFLPALLGADRRTLYDRLAGTEVVRVRA